jgi:uncharacterized FlgJ-related protein
MVEDVEFYRYQIERSQNTITKIGEMIEQQNDAIEQHKLLIKAFDLAIERLENGN